MANFGSIGDVNEQASYVKSFGNKANGTVYYDGAKGVDKRLGVKDNSVTMFKAIEAHFKAFTDSTIMTVPVIMDTDIIDTVRKETPLVELVKRRTQVGKAISYNKLTAIGDAVFYTEADFETPSLVKDTYVNVTDTIKLSWTGGQITGFAQAADKHFIDLYAERVRNAVYAMKRLHENMILNGDTAVTTDGYDGIIKTAGNVFYSTDTGATGGVTEDLTVARVLEANGTAKNVQIGNKIGVTDWNTANILKAELMNSVKYIDTSTPFAWGIRGVFYVEELPVMTNKFLSKASGSREFVIIDLDWIEFRVLQEMTLVEMAITGDSRQFFIKEYSTLINRYPTTHSVIKEIK